METSENKTNFAKCFSVYVPINPRLPSERQIKITIVSNGNGMLNARQDWNIAVHQFECPFGQSRLQNAVQAASESDINVVNRQPRTFISDWLAPPGCLQYHANPSGMIETFNFNNGAGRIESNDGLSRLSNRFFRSVHWQHAICNMFPTRARKFSSSVSSKLFD